MPATKPCIVQASGVALSLMIFVLCRVIITLVVTQDVAALLLGDAGSSGLHCIPASLSCQADEQKDYTKLVVKS